MHMKRWSMPSIGTAALLAALFATAGLPAARAAHRTHAATPAAAPAGAPSTPQAPLEALYKALDQSEHSRGGVNRRSALIAPAVDQAFDMDAILKRSVGLHYDQLSAEERNNLVAAFKRFTVARYASTFKPGTDAVFTVAQSGQQNGHMLVHTTIGSKADPASAATSIDYIMTQGPNGWRITDILLDGHISQVAAQRSDFKSVFNQSGASGLARTLTKKADDFLRE